jgi:hypothetical protein
MERINRYARNVLIVIAVVYVLAGCIDGLANGWLARFLDALSRVLGP